MSTLQVNNSFVVAYGLTLIREVPSAFLLQCSAMFFFSWGGGIKRSFKGGGRHVALKKYIFNPQAQVIKLSNFLFLQKSVSEAPKDDKFMFQTSKFPVSDGGQFWTIKSLGTGKFLASDKEGNASLKDSPIDFYLWFRFL